MSDKVRSRDSILEILVKMDREYPYITRTQLISFLYIAENPGINMVELSAVSGFSLPTASRAARSLAPKSSAASLPPYFGLIDIFHNPTDPRGRILVLSEEGVRRCEQIDEVIRRATTISYG
jgi:DNA-binding MarR family transcriptional regulator